MVAQPGSVDALLSVEEVARQLDVQPVTVYRWCRNGRLRCLKPGKSWRIRRTDLDAFLHQSQQPRTLTEYLNRFLAVPDQVLAMTEDAHLLTQLDAAFFQVAQDRQGLLIKLYDPAVLCQTTLKADLERQGVLVELLEASGRFRWCPAPDVEAGIAALQQILEEDETAEQTLWAMVNWPSGDDVAAGLRQQERLAALVATHPRLVVITGAVVPKPLSWPTLNREWQLLSNLRGLIRIAHAGLLLGRLLPPQPA